MRKFQLEKGKKIPGTHGGEFAGEGEGVDLLDAAGGDEGLVLFGRGQQQGGVVGIQELGDVREEA